MPSKKKRGKQRKAARAAASPSANPNGNDGVASDDPYALNREHAAEFRERLMRDRVAVGLDPVDARPAKEERLPDYPSCDGCGSEYCGTMECTACQSAYYCSKACQREHWKNGGHKARCSTLKEHAQSVAKSTVDGLSDERLPPLLRAQSLKDNPLDMSGPYKFAVGHGLHDAIYSAFIEDHKAVENHTNPNSMYHCSLTQWVMQSLFRGERISRTIHHQSNSFGKVDGGRIQGFIQDHPEDGLQVWWKASLEAAMVFLHPRFSSHESFRCHQMARDIWAMWALVFASKRASESILLAHDKARCLERATWMLGEMRPYLARLQRAREGVDRNEVVQAYFNQVPAMIAAQCRELAGVPSVDPPKILKLRGLDAKMYHNIAKPHGEDMIKKKRAADNERSMKILRKANAFG